jgi:coenzyme Q-binding protein COQ10
MTKIVKSIEIGASPEKVFAFMISDKMNEVWGKWMDGKWTSKGPVGLGSIGHFVAKPDFKIKGEWDEVVTEFEENKKMAMRTVEGSKIKMGVTGLVEPSGNGTKVTYIEDYDVPYSVLGKLIDKLSIQKGTEKFMDEMMENLKKAIET